MPSPSSAERKRQRLAERLRRVGADVSQIAFEAAREVVRNGFRDVPFEYDPYDYFAACEEAMYDAAEQAVAAAGFDVNDPQVWDEIFDTVQHVRDLDSSAAVAGSPFDGDPRESWAAHRALYGESQRSTAEASPPSLEVGVEQHRRRPRSNCGARRRPGTRRVRRTSGSRGDPDLADDPEPPSRGRGAAHTQRLDSRHGAGWAL